MASKQRRMWVYSPRKRPGPKMPDSVRSGVEHAASELIDKVLKPKHIKPPPKGRQFNYLVDIYTKWYRDSFYFCGLYNSPGSHAVSPSFEVKFARMEYRGPSSFNIAYLRHTGEWIEVYRNLSLTECLKEIRDGAWFQP